MQIAALRNLLPFGLAFALLVAFAVQYPLSTTFPIGGDAAAYIRDAQKPLLAGLTHSRYPLSLGIFHLSRLLPVEWPDRYVWWMALGHVATGVVLGLLLLRLADWSTAATGTVLWALTSTSVNPLFEDGTLAQLWSLPFLLLFFERIAKGSGWGIIAALAGTALAHSFSGLVAAASLLISVPSLVGVRRRIQSDQRRLLIYLAGSLGILFLALIMLYPHVRPFIDNFPRDDRSVSVLEFIRSYFGPFIVLAPAGLLLLIRNVNRQTVVKVTLVAFFFVVALMAFNNLLGPSTQTFRFQPYFILSVTILAAVAAVALARLVFHNTAWQLLFLLLLIGVPAAYAWHSSSSIYAQYESPIRNLRLHPEEKAAMEWLRDGVDSRGLIASSQSTRDSEWIPILSGHQWDGLWADNELFHLEGDALAGYVGQLPYTHVFFFKHHEDTWMHFYVQPDVFDVVFENDAVVVFKMP